MRARRRSLRVVASLAVCVSAFAAGTPWSGAANVQATRAQAARIAAQLDAGAQRIAELGAKLAEAKARLAATDAALAQASAMLGAAEQRYGQVKARLADQAVNSYIHGGAISLVEQLARSRGQDLPVRNQYAAMAAGADREAIDDLIAVRQDLGVQRGSLERLRASRQAEVDSLAAQQAALLRAENAETALLARVKGQLAALLAAEQRRRDARRSTADGPWACIRQLESGNNYSAPGGGAYQFEDSTWHSLGQSGTASDAPPSVQDAMAVELQQRAGWDQWTTAKRCGR